jgi:hypothetical protein
MADQKINGTKKGRGAVKGEFGTAAHVVTAENKKLVAAYMIAGLSQEQAARSLGISVDTLDKHYRHELDNSHADAVAGVGGTLLQRAMAGDTSSMIFYLKTRGRWSETQRLEHSGPDGGKIEVEQSQTAASLLSALAAAKVKAEGGEPS